MNFAVIMPIVCALGAVAAVSSIGLVISGRVRRRNSSPQPGWSPATPGPPVRISAELMESIIRRLMLADAKDKYGNQIPPVELVTHRKEPAIKWDGHVLYCDPGLDPRSPEYAIRVEGVGRCIRNLVTLNAAGNGGPDQLVAQIMEYLDKAEVLVVPAPVP